MRTKRTVHTPDLAAIQSYAERHPRMIEAVELGGIRTVVTVPMLKDDDLVGVIAVHRREVRPFTEKQFSSAEAMPTNKVAAMMPQTKPRYLANIRFALHEPPPDRKGDCITSAQNPTMAWPIIVAHLRRSTLDRHLGNPAYRRALWVVLAINGAMFLVEIGAGLAAGSASLQADAFDFLGDAANYAISLFVVGMALRYRATAAMIKGLTMGAFGLWIIGTVIWHACTAHFRAPLQWALSASPL